MEIKDRVIRIGKGKHNSNQVDCIIMEEIGIQDGEVFHRNIAINENIYADFERNIDKEMLLDAFLDHHNINSEWIRYPLNVPKKHNLENETEDPSSLPTDIDLDSIQSGMNPLNTLTKRKMYNELSERENLIDNPLIMDVFNEAIRDDSELSIWESVYPFFR